jgi:hypothetical protein
MMKMAVLAGLVCCVMLPCVPNASAGSQPVLREQLTVESRGGRVLLHLRFLNASAHPVYVLKSLASEHEPEGRLFDIRDTGTDTLIAYHGMMAKRGPPTAADYVAIGPRASHHNTIELTDNYAFEPGIHVYELTHSTHYLTQLRDLNAHQPLTTKPVRFSHLGR